MGQGRPLVLRRGHGEQSENRRLPYRRLQVFRINAESIPRAGRQITPAFWRQRDRCFREDLGSPHLKGLFDGSLFTAVLSSLLYRWERTSFTLSAASLIPPTASDSQSSASPA